MKEEDQPRERNELFDDMVHALAYLKVLGLK